MEHIDKLMYQPGDYVRSQYQKFFNIATAIYVPSMVSAIFMYEYIDKYFTIPTEWETNLLN